MRRAWLLLLFAAALALWLWRSPHGQSPDTATTSSGAPTQPGYVAINAELIDTNEAGQPQYSLRATQISQPTPAADIELEAPLFTYRGETEWTLTAARGTLPPSVQQVSLLGSVVAHAQRPGAVPLQLRTTSLGIDMAAQTADSADAVVMDWGRNRLWAAGLHADMKAGELKLKSPVHGEIARLEQ
ncbi:MAG: LPS export ABC transporter periplasmic protein LptC [Gammaproteobacteria bacterium]|nr:LPS export ABC transporter periplasmic protein LptC [Gammaproteobacteria bacterium]MDE2250703.1 LPS export ABC transporter periplasmic protein LptC [Gammaproteobacteria bacterium]